MSRRVGRRGRRGGHSAAAGMIGSNLLAYFDPAVSVAQTGGSVDSWASSAGSVAATVSASLTQRPTLATFNGRTVLAFAQASSQRLAQSASALAAALSGVTTYTLYAAVNHSNGAVATTTLGTCDGAGVAGYIAHATTAIGSNNRDQYSRSTVGVGTTNNFSAGTAWPATMAAGCQVFDGANVTSYVNGSVVQTGANSRNVGAQDLITIGAACQNAGAINGFMDGQIGRIAIYSGTHNAAQVAQMTLWLRQYYFV